MTASREWIRILDRLAEGDDELAREAERQREIDVLKIPMALQVDAAGKATSPSGLFRDEELATVEARHRDHLAVHEMLSDADEILAQGDDTRQDDLPPEEPPPAP